MGKQTIKHHKFAGALACCAVVGLLAAFPNAALAQSSGAQVNKVAVGPNGVRSPARAHVGDTITATLTYTNKSTLIGHVHTITSMVDRVHHDLPVGDQDSANLVAFPPGVGPLGFDQGFERVDTYTVLPTDAVAPPHFLLDDNLVRGTDSSPTDPNIPIIVQIGAAVTILRPNIDLTKTCTLIGDAANPLIEIKLKIDNTGDTKLFAIRVVDDNGTPGNTADDITFGDGVPAGDVIPDLDPGGTFTITSQYTATINPSINTATVTAFDVLGLSPTGDPTVDARGRVTDTANCTVTIPCAPAIRVTKDCVVVGTIGALTVNYSGTVFNEGNVTLTGVTVQDDKGGGPINIGTLAPAGQAGSSAPYSGSYALPANTPCDSDVTDSVTATGTFPAICLPIGGVHTVSANDSATCRTPPCNPECTVFKEIACDLPGDSCGTFGPVATGVKDGDCPSFCYRIRIHNDSATVPITSLTVTDTVLGDLTARFAGQLPLAPGLDATTTITGIEHCQDTRNVVTAICRSASGASHTDEAEAQALVKNIDVDCRLILFSSFDMYGNAGPPGDNHVTLPADGPVQVTIVLINRGSAPLNVTSLSGLPPIKDCTSGAAVDPNSLLLPNFIIGPNSERELFLGCVDVVCTDGLSFRVTVNAEADDQNGTLCIYNDQGVKITDSNSASPCPGSVDCQQPVTCRVTGGGVLLDATVDQSCIPVETTIFPLTSPNGLTIRKITHGGQLGAPFSQEDCVPATLGNPCIRGQWQHTRHYEGNGNPRDVIDMNFHSVTPKGQFDTLTCACLGCCDADGGFITPITVGSICNPDDHKVCGPQPRPAPANAIIFSGVGKITPVDDFRGSRAAQAEWIVFRVYIEDRSEPGGHHPKGAVEPADIYCFQAWKTGIKVSKKPDFSAVAPAFRMALTTDSCDFLEALRTGNQVGAYPAGMRIGSLPTFLTPTIEGITAEIQDCGPLNTGNHQIHPATGATCTE